MWEWTKKIVQGLTTRGQLSKVGIVQGGIVGEGGNCPRWDLSGGQLSRGQLPRCNYPRGIILEHFPLELGGPRMK